MVSTLSVKSIKTCMKRCKQLHDHGLQEPSEMWFSPHRQEAAAPGGQTKCSISERVAELGLRAKVSLIATCTWW